MFAQNEKSPVEGLKTRSINIVKEHQKFVSIINDPTFNACVKNHAKILEGEIKRVFDADDFYQIGVMRAWRTFLRKPNATVSYYIQAANWAMDDQLKCGRSVDSPQSLNHWMKRRPRMADESEVLLYIHDLIEPEEDHCLDLGSNRDRPDIPLEDGACYTTFLQGLTDEERLVLDALTERRGQEGMTVFRASGIFGRRYRELKLQVKQKFEAAYA